MIRSRATALLAASLAVFLFLLAYLALRPDGERDPTAQPASAAAPQDRADVDAVGAELPEEPLHGRRDVASTEPTEATAPDTEADHGPWDGVPLRVRFRDTGEPAPGATVESASRSHFGPEGDRVANTRMLAKGRLEDYFGALTPGKARYRADANGVVRVEVEGFQHTLLARAERDGVIFGGHLDLVQARFAQGESELVLHMDPLVHRWVELRDADGAAVPNAPVVVVGSPSADLHAQYPWRQSHGKRIVVAAGRTDSDGRARLEERVAAWSTLSDLRIAVDLLFDPPVEVPCSAEVIGPLVEITLPPAGEVHVRGAQSWAVLALSDDHSPGDQRALRQGDVVRFPHVGLGLELRTGAGLSFQPNMHVFAGPTRAGEVVEVELLSDAGTPSRKPTQLRLVDSAGAPVADRVVAVIERTSGQSMLYDDLTDASGGLDYTPRLATQAGEWDLVLETLFDPSVDAERLRGELDHWEETWTEREVVLWPVPVLCSGRVVDAVGDAVEGVEVWIEPLPPDEPASSDPTLEDPKATTDSQGRFVLQGVLESLEEQSLQDWRWYISAKKSGYPNSAPVEFVQGQVVELVLPRPAELMFEVLWPAALERSSLTLSIEGGGATGWLREVPGSLRALSTDVHSVRYTTFDGPSGPAQIFAHSRIDGATLGQWAVFSAPLERRSLPTFDWTSAFDLAPLEIRFPDGETGAQVVLQFELDGHRGRVVLQHPLAANPVLLPKPLTPATLRASAAGWQRLEGTWDGSPQRLAFASGWEVKFVLPGHLAMPTEYGQLSVQLQGGVRDFHWLRQSENGSFHVTLSSLDGWRAQARLSESKHPFGPHCEIELDRESLAAGLPVNLPFDPLEWRAWIDRLSED